MDKQILKIGIPKGSLQDSTIDMFCKAGYKITVSSRSYYPYIDDESINLMLIRAQEMARYVEEGILDAGLSGKDWVTENNADIVIISELVYAKTSNKPVKWVLAVHKDSNIKSVKDLEGKRIATEAVELAKKYLAQHKVNAHVEFSWGATEVKCPALVDAIIEITETGSSLKANDLIIIDEVMVSVTQFIANKDAWKDEWKCNKLKNIDMLLHGVLEAENKVGILLNTKKENLDKLLKILPALQKPTVSPLSDDNWIALNTIIEEHTVRELIPELKKAGATGIVEYPLNKIIK